MYICVIYSDIYLHMYKNRIEDQVKKDELFFYSVTPISKLKIHFWEQTSAGTLYMSGKSDNKKLRTATKHIFVNIS